MGLFDRFKVAPTYNEDDPANENINQIAGDRAVDLIKKLSGGSIKYTTKVADNVIVFCSASGGAGSSTIVSNVAYLTTLTKLRVLVIDLNIMYPIQNNYFSSVQEIEKPDLVSFLLGKNKIGECIESDKNISLLYAHNRGLMDSINCESNEAIANFTDMINQVRPLFDLIIIDTPLRVDHMLSNTAFYMCDQIYTVWDESITSIANTEKIRRNMVSSGIDAYSKMKVILNKKTDIHYSRYPFDKLNIELVKIMPFDTSIIESGLRAQVYCQKGASSSKNAAAFYSGMQEITSKILEAGGYIA